MPTMNAESLKAFARDPAAFRSSLVVDVDGNARMFSEVAEQRQLDDFAAGDPGWRQAIGLEPNGQPRRIWSERPRGSSKTTDAAISIIWALAFCPNRATGIAASGDFDQCKILAAAVRSLLDCNPYLTSQCRDRDTNRTVPMLDVQSNRIRNGRTGSEVIILSADAATSYGYLADWLVVDEISNWPDSGEKLWISLASTLAKRARAMALVISNSGFTESWQWRVREAIRADARWHLSHWDSPPTWMSAETLAEQERILPVGPFQRLFGNVWISGAGDALDDESIQNAICPENIAAEPGGPWSFTGGLDLGIRRDFSAFAMVGRHLHNGHIRLAQCWRWKPPRGGQVDLADVQNTVAEANRIYRPAAILVDPHQAAQMTQTLVAEGAPMVETFFTSSNLQRMASVLLDHFRSGTIAITRDEALIKDLRKLRIVERPWGFRLEANRDATGHADLATAFVLALLGSKDYFAAPIEDTPFMRCNNLLDWVAMNERYERRLQAFQGGWPD